MTAAKFYDTMRTDRTAERPWLTQAACANTPTTLFYPERGEHHSAAIAVCNTCPVKNECLQWALDNNETFGVWGGTTASERRRIQRGRPVAPQPTQPRCGTPAGYRQHQTAGTPTCNLCRAAWAEYQADHRRSA